MLLGFKREFAVPIKKGTKVFTLRFPRKRKAKIGETLYMYSELRTNRTRLISKKFTLKSVQRVRLTIFKNESGVIDFALIADFKNINSKIRKFALLDGFQTLDEFFNYWLDGKDHVSHRLDLYHWTDLRF